MPIRVSVTVRGQLVSKKFEDFSNTELPKIGRGRIWGALEAARKKIIVYPPTFKGKFEFVSPKQRKYFFWALREGIIKVPYERTGNYGRAWQVVKGNENTWRLVGNLSGGGRDYLKYVGGNAYGKEQARIHQGRWRLVRATVDQEIRRLPDQIQQRVTIAGKKL